MSSEKFKLGLLWQTDKKNIEVARYRKSDCVVVESSVVDLERVALMLKYYMEYKNIDTLNIDGLKIVKSKGGFESEY